MRIRDVQVVTCQIAQEYRQADVLVFPECVRAVDAFAFQDAPNLIHVKFENGVSTIGTCAFARCQTLATVHFPQSLSEIGAGAFRECLNLQSVTFDQPTGESVSIRFFANTFAKCGVDGNVIMEENERRRQRRDEVDITRNRGFFQALYERVMRPEDSYPGRFRQECERFANVQDWGLAGDEMLRRMYYNPDNVIAEVGNGAMSIQFANYNGHHPNEAPITWENLDRGVLSDVCNQIRNLNIESPTAERIISDCWDKFVSVVRYKLSVVFNRMIAALRPDIILRVPQTEAVDVLYNWLTYYHIISLDILPNTPVTKWFRQNRQIYQFLASCLEGRDMYQIGSFAWYFVEVFRMGEENHPLGGFVNEKYPIISRWDN